MRSKTGGGFTLVDIVLMLMLLAILVVSSTGFYVSLLHRHEEVTQRITALNLAKAQVEDLLAMNYDDVVTGPPTIVAPGGYTVAYIVGPETLLGGMHFKTITATTTIDTNPRAGPVSLTGFKTDNQ